MEENVNIKRLLNNSIDELGFKSEGEIKYGWNKKTAGIKIRDTRDQLFWFRVQYRSKEQQLDKLWFGELDSADFNDIKKPRLIGYNEWETNSLLYRADILEYISCEICSPSPDLRITLPLSEKWFEDLVHSLENLKVKRTARVNVRQELIDRRIRERFGKNIDTRITNWITIHGDLHWANLTQPNCWILDWESWGKGPIGLDVSFLYFFSLLQPQLAEKIYNMFKEDLESRDGKISQLFACAELLRMIELHNDHPMLKEPLNIIASNLISSFAAI